MRVSTRATGPFILVKGWFGQRFAAHHLDVVAARHDSIPHGREIRGRARRRRELEGDAANLEVDDIELLAKGGEWLDTPNPTPTPQPTLFDDFTGPTLNKDMWLLANKAWGGANGGVIPENVSLSNGTLKLKGNGDRYSGTTTGLGGRKTRVGAALVTRNYYASGRYEVRAKVLRQLGACTAFWSYHYIEYTPSQPEYWQEPNRIRNSEIDWNSLRLPMTAVPTTRSRSTRRGRTRGAASSAAKVATSRSGQTSANSSATVTSTPTRTVATAEVRSHALHRLVD